MQKNTDTTVRKQEPATMATTSHVKVESGERGQVHVCSLCVHHGHRTDTKIQYLKLGVYFDFAGANIVPSYYVMV